MPGPEADVAEATADVVDATSEETALTVVDEAEDEVVSNEAVEGMEDVAEEDIDVGTLCRKAGSGLGIPDMVA